MGIHRCSGRIGTFGGGGGGGGKAGGPGIRAVRQASRFSDSRSGMPRTAFFFCDTRRGARSHGGAQPRSDRRPPMSTGCCDRSPPAEKASIWLTIGLRRSERRTKPVAGWRKRAALTVRGKRPGAGKSAGEVFGGNVTGGFGFWAKRALQGPLSDRQGAGWLKGGSVGTADGRVRARVFNCVPGAGP